MNLFYVFSSSFFLFYGSKWISILFIFIRYILLLVLKSVVFCCCCCGLSWWIFYCCLAAKKSTETKNFYSAIINFVIHSVVSICLHINHSYISTTIFPLATCLCSCFFFVWLKCLILVSHLIFDCASTNHSKWMATLKISWECVYWINSNISSYLRLCIVIIYVGFFSGECFIYFWCVCSSVFVSNIRLIRVDSII